MKLYNSRENWKKSLEVLVGSCLNTSQLCAQAGQEEMPQMAPWEVYIGYEEKIHH